MRWLGVGWTSPFVSLAIFGTLPVFPSHGLSVFLFCAWLAAFSNPAQETKQKIPNKHDVLRAIANLRAKIAHETKNNEGIKKSCGAARTKHVVDGSWRRRWGSLWIGILGACWLPATTEYFDLWSCDQSKHRLVLDGCSRQPLKWVPSLGKANSSDEGAKLCLQKQGSPTLNRTCNRAYR